MIRFDPAVLAERVEPRMRAPVPTPGPDEVKTRDVCADPSSMVFDVLVVASVAGAIWWWQRRPRPARHARGDDDLLLLPYEDLPPIGAFDPVPDDDDLDSYISSGMDRLNSYLSRRDHTA